MNDEGMSGGSGETGQGRPGPADLLRGLMRRAPQLVTVVTAVGDDGPRGITVSSFTSVSLDPALVLISIGTASRSRSAIRSGRFRVHLLAEDQAAVSNHFAQPGRTSAEQFGDACRSALRSGAPPLLPGCVGWLECAVTAEHEEADHTLFIGRVLGGGIDRPAVAPLVYQDRGYHRLTR